jgi:hypothetical protein
MGDGEGGGTIAVGDGNGGDGTMEGESVAGSRCEA